MMVSNVHVMLISTDCGKSWKSRRRKVTVVIVYEKRTNGEQGRQNGDYGKLRGSYVQPKDDLTSVHGVPDDFAGVDCSTMEIDLRAALEQDNSWVADWCSNKADQRCEDATEASDAEKCVSDWWGEKGVVCPKDLEAGLKQLMTPSAKEPKEGFRRAMREISDNGVSWGAELTTEMLKQEDKEAECGISGSLVIWGYAWGNQRYLGPTVRNRKSKHDGSGLRW